MTASTLGHVLFGAVLGCECVGTGVGLEYWRTLSPGSRWITGWLASSALADVVDIPAEHYLHDAQCVTHVWFVPSVICVAGAVAAFQRDDRRPRWFWWVAALYCVVWLVLTLTFEPLYGYSPVLSVAHAAVLLIMGATTMLRRVATGRHDLVADPAFLAGSALFALSIPSVLLSPFLELFLRSDTSAVMAYFSAKNVINVLVVVVMILGLRIDGRSRLVTAH